MPWLAAVFSLLLMIAGWHYLFYSRAAQNLGAIEQTGVNLKRVRLRRAGGAVMMLLGIAFYAGTYTYNEHRDPRAFLAVWSAVLVLLGAIVLLALLDLRLTWKLRRQVRGQDQP